MERNAGFRKHAEESVSIDHDEIPKPSRTFLRAQLENFRSESSAVMKLSVLVAMMCREFYHHDGLPNHAKSPSIKAGVLSVH